MDAKPSHYYFVNPVWGDLYVERFLKLSLPSQLSAGNLGSIPRGKGRYLIYTRKEYRRVIARSAAYQRLRDLVDTSIEFLDDLPDPRLSRNPHELQTAAYTRGLRSAAGRDAAFVFMTPDTLFGDGTFRAMVRRAEEGKRCHLIVCIRMLVDGAFGCLVQHREANRAEVAIPCRELVRSGLDNLHPISNGHLVENGRVRAFQHLYHRIGSRGLLARGFHLHPLLVWPRNPEATIRNTLDDEYIERACPDPADWFIATDSDEMCVFEFSERCHKTAMVAEKPLGDRELANFLHKCTTDAHRRHVLSRVRVHTGEVTEAEWAAVEPDSDALVENMLELHGRGIPVEVVIAAAEPPPIPFVARAAKAITFPFRAMNRLVNFKLYRYADRLNAQVLNQQFQLNQITRQLNHASKLVTDLVDRVGVLEEEASRSAAAAEREAAKRRRLALRLRFVRKSKIS